MKKIKFSAVIAGALSCAVLLSACTIGGSGSIATVNGEPVSKSLYQFYLNQEKASLEQQEGATAEDFWENGEIDGKKAIEVARENAMDQVVQMAIIDQKAKDANMKLSQEDIAAIGQQKNQIMEQFGGREKFQEELKNQGITEDQYQEMLENNFFASKLMEEKTKDIDEAAAKKYFNESIVRVKHVLIMTVNQSDGTPLPEDQLAAAKAKAEEVLAKAKAGEDFDALVAEYSEDPGSKSQPDGYYLGEGFALGSQGGMVKPFEEASLALEVDGISEIVESNFGYHIIKRYANDEAKFEESKDEITHYAKVAAFRKIQEQWKSEATIEIDENEYTKIK